MVALSSYRFFKEKTLASNADYNIRTQGNHKGLPLQQYSYKDCPYNISA
ncbi:MAG: hypothetical protein KAI83_17115 [Thiomargarita sp.]|nr:hypothetical protein [Thiomargarita sp.]